MVYEIKWKPKSLKSLQKLRKEDKIRIMNKIDCLIENPFRYLKHYEGVKVFKLRVGDYRILVDVDLKRKILFIEVWIKGEDL